MTPVLPGLGETATPATDFPLGGRPQEWRALEESAAFEKWFERDGGGPPQSSQQARGDAGEAPSDASQESRHAAEAPPVARGVAARDAAGQAVSAPHPVRGRAVDTGNAPAARFAAAVGVRPAIEAIAVQAPDAGERAAIVARHAWSRTALTAVVDGADRRVRLWVRDYRLAAGDLEQLERILGEQLRSLGYRLAQLVINGEQRY